MKSILVLLCLVGLIFIYRRTKFDDDKYLHYPAPRMIDNQANISNTHSVGSYQHEPELTQYEQLSRKKINNYIFVFENGHKVEVALVDLGYASVVQANYFFQEHTYSFEKQVSFTLPENFNDRTLQINDKGIGHEFTFNSAWASQGKDKAVVTDMHVKFFNNDQSFIHFTLQHKQPSERCVTYLRQGIVSYKCYGGVASGSFQIEMKENMKVTYSLWKKIDQDISTAGFDGFRASGWQWEWVWGMGAGTSEGRHLSLNLGTINNIGEDVFYIDNTMIPIKGVEYIINQNATVADSIAFKSTSPESQLEFKITAKDHKYKDMGVLKIDMVKFQGYWSGYLIDPATQEKLKFDAFPGLVETADSIF